MDFGLLSFLKEHSSLRGKNRHSNWYHTYHTFTSSADLKASLRRQFEPTVTRDRLIAAISENRFPLFTVSVDVEPITIGHRQSMNIRALVKNIGCAAAFNFIVHWKETEKNNRIQTFSLPVRKFP
ncbi:MAG TPA: hypothetical protein VFE46_15365 [Pirellulales bacterium]|jgi:hypothetical protein|nr:hypothetical protein [Pirellulales bacterium]